MTEVNLPKVLLLRVQNQLGKVVANLYSTDEENIVRAVLENGDSVYYDLAARKVVSLSSQSDTDKLTGGKKAEKETPRKPRDGIFDAMISRPETTDTIAPEKKGVKTTTKKTSITKKKK